MGVCHLLSYWSFIYAKMGLFYSKNLHKRYFAIFQKWPKMAASLEK